MAKYELLLPKMGESVAEATIVKWTKKPGDTIDEDDIVVEIATDKVDSDVPSPVSGKILEILFKENDVVQVGKPIAIIEIEGAEQQAPINTAEIVVPDGPEYTPFEHVPAEPVAQEQPAEQAQPEPTPVAAETNVPEPAPQSEPVDTAATAIPGIDMLLEKSKAESVTVTSNNEQDNGFRFYSPLVRNIAVAEGISQAELDGIPGTGAEGRLTKDDLKAYLNKRSSAPQQQSSNFTSPQPQPAFTATPEKAPERVTISQSGDEIIEMDRMRRIIADHMVMSKQTSPHVSSFVEVDVTELVHWRDKVKGAFEKREGQKITFTPIFVEAVAKAIKDFPMINISVSGTQIIKKKDINISLATALPNGNLIVPVIKKADELSLPALTKTVNDLALRARNNKLQPDEVKGGTFTLTNIGSFGNDMGIPIINQPQVAILAIGTIKKKPAVIETMHGDLIAIRHMMFLSMSYDHRVVDGMLGGMFLRRVADYLEKWDSKREI